MKTGTVTKQEFKKEYDSKYGTMYAFNIELGNGDKGETSTKKKDAQFEGQTINYDIEETQYGNKIKIIRDKINGFKRDPEVEKLKQQMIIAQSSLDRSVALAIAGKIEMKDIEASTDRFMSIINKLAVKHNV